MEMPNDAEIEQVPPLRQDMNIHYSSEIIGELHTSLLHKAGVLEPSRESLPMMSRGEIESSVRGGGDSKRAST